MEFTDIYQSERGSMHYHLSGEGPPVLMIMGFMARAYAWRSQVEALSQSYQVLCFDHYGVGDSTGDPATSMKSFAQDCFELMNHVGWNDAHIMGVSMGGMIAQHMALSHSDRVRSLILLVTHSGGFRRLLPPRKGIPLFLKAQFSSTPQARLHALIPLLLPETVSAQRSTQDLITGLSLDFTPKPAAKTRFSHFWAIFKHRTHARLHEISCPTLIVQAKKDLLVNPKGSDDLHQAISHSKIFTITSAGHGVIRQQNTHLNDRIIKHLSSVD